MGIFAYFTLRCTFALLHYLNILSLYLTCYIHTIWVPFPVQCILWERRLRHLLSLLILHCLQCVFLPKLLYIALLPCCTALIHIHIHDWLYFTVTLLHTWAVALLLRYIALLLHHLICCTLALLHCHYIYVALFKTGCEHIIHIHIRDRLYSAVALLLYCILELLHYCCATLHYACTIWYEIFP